MCGAKKSPSDQGELKGAIADLGYQSSQVYKCVRTRDMACLTDAGSERVCKAFGPIDRSLYCPR